jgi:hypothetical protein
MFFENNYQKLITAAWAIVVGSVLTIIISILS